MLYQLSYLAKQRLILLATKTRGLSRVLYQLSYLAKRTQILLTRKPSWGWSYRP